MKKKPKIIITPKKVEGQVNSSEMSGSKIPKKELALDRNISNNIVKLKKIMSDNKLLVSGLTFIFLSLFLVLSNYNKSNNHNTSDQKELPSADGVDIKEPPKEVPPSKSENLDLSELLAVAQKREGYRQNIKVLDSITSIKTLLQKERIPKRMLNELVYLAQENNIDILKKGKTWYTIKSKAADESTEKFYIYEESPSQYFVINGQPKPEIKSITKEVHIKIKSIAGVIKTSLWDAVRDSDGDDRVVGRMEEALKWVVDFYHVAPNDKFKIIYEEEWVDDKMVGVAKLLAVTFYTNNKIYDAYYYKDEKIEGYFNRMGQSMKKKFLKSPVKYNKITSAYNPERVHPVLGDKRPHLGTDFFANKADPIFAVGDGTVTAATFKKNNGNYVKIKHDNIYQTQYLHIMENGFAEGIKVGAKVKQGQVIGYAGQTGLATGVHVCFRFWKNGAQVDPLKEEAVQSDVPTQLDKESFQERKDSLLLQMDEIPFFDLSF